MKREFYKDGKFKFNITFPTNFSQTPPKVIFQSRIFQSPVLGVDFSNLSKSQWNYTQQNMLYNTTKNESKAKNKL